MSRPPAAVGDGEDLQCVAIGIVPVEPAATLGPCLVDARLLVARAGVRCDVVVGQALFDLLELRGVSRSRAPGTWHVNPWA